jgi:hypothetical protein
MAWSTGCARTCRAFRADAGQTRNYEVKFTWETKAFQRLEVELRKSLDSFRELQGAAEKTIL